MEQRNYELTAALQQQTPMIHFQCRDPKATLDNRKKHLAKWSADSIWKNPDIAGATLRATEVKPKLDRFVQGWCAKRGWKIPCDWKTPAVTGRAPALRYRMRIRAEGKNSPEVREPYRNLFFGNTGKDTGGEYVFQMFQSGPILLQLYCFQNIRLFDGQPKPEASKLPQGFPENPTLLELLAYVLPAFFAGHCFGMRSSKGFGSFRCTDVNGKRQPDLDNDAYLRYLGQFYGTFYYIDGLNPQDPKNAFNIIRDIAGMMKSGFNKKPGLLFRYFTERGIKSDKKFMKDYVLAGKVLADKEKPNYKFSRAMLGLAPKYFFPKRDINVNVEHKDKKIARFQSPVQFCAQGSRLYLMLREIPDAMFGAEFQFISSAKKKGSQEKSPTLFTPTKTAFNLIQYLDYFQEKFTDRTIERFPAKGGAPRA